MCDLTAPYFQDEDKAREHLESLRWPNGPFCPHCGSEKEPMKLQGKSHRPGLYKCSEYQCRKQFTVTVGTVFERSRVPLNKWLLAVHLMCASKKGISAHQLHRMLGVTYKTALFMAHRIREAMKDSDGTPLGSNGGTVEADETFWGNNKPKGQKKGRGYSQKMKVLSLVDRNGKKRSFHVDRVNAATLKPYLEQHIAADANLMTDEASAYTLIGRSFATHGIVRHGLGEYAKGLVNTNSAESSFALLKRGLRGVFHHVGEQHLQRYVAEFDFRRNFRVKNGFEDRERSEALLSQIGGKRLLYRDSYAA